MAVDDHIEALSTKIQELEEGLAIALALMPPDLLTAYKDFQAKRLLKKEKGKEVVKVEATGELLQSPITFLDR